MTETEIRLLRHFRTILLLLLGATAPAPAGDAPPARGLPITWHVDGKTIEVPLSTNQLGWMISQSRDIIVEAIPRPIDDDLIDGEPVPPPLRKEFPIHDGEKAITLECFDLWIFGDLAEERRKLWLLTLLSERVVAAKQRGLSVAEEEKLILAGRGDIKHFYDRFKQTRAEFALVRTDLRQGRRFLHAMIGGGSTLPVDFQEGPFGNDSLFAKTLKGVESSRQVENTRIKT